MYVCLLHATVHTLQGTTNRQNKRLVRIKCKNKRITSESTETAKNYVFKSFSSCVDVFYMCTFGILGNILVVIFQEQTTQKKVSRPI